MKLNFWSHMSCLFLAVPFVFILYCIHLAGVDKNWEYIFTLLVIFYKIEVANRKNQLLAKRLGQEHDEKENES